MPSTFSQKILDNFIKPVSSQLIGRIKVEKMEFMVQLYQYHVCLALIVMVGILCEHQR